MLGLGQGLISKQYEGMPWDDGTVYFYYGNSKKHCVHLTKYNHCSLKIDEFIVCKYASIKLILKQKIISSSTYISKYHCDKNNLSSQ